MRHSTFVEVYHQSGRTPALILCDHAGKEVPGGAQALGITEVALSHHIGWDIGAADVTRQLAELLDAPAVLCHSSRLLVDPNRAPQHPSAIPTICDGVAIPGNQALNLDEINHRLRTYFLPYHRSVARQIAAFRRRGITPALISIHSFTPRMHGNDRPWQIGVLWRKDRRIAGAVMAALREHGELCIGDNEPYSAFEYFGYTVPFHGERTGLPHVLFEIRQDEINTRDKASHYAKLLAKALAASLFALT